MQRKWYQPTETLEDLIFLYVAMEEICISFPARWFSICNWHFFPLHQQDYLKSNSLNTNGENCNKHCICRNTEKRSRTRTDQCIKASQDQNSGRLQVPLSLGSFFLPLESRDPSSYNLKSRHRTVPSKKSPLGRLNPRTLPIRQGLTNLISSPEHGLANQIDFGGGMLRKHWPFVA